MEVEDGKHLGDETPEQRENRLAMSGCMNSEVIFRGVRDGLCYFEVYFTDDSDGPRTVLSLPTNGLTAEKVANRAAEAGRRRRRTTPTSMIRRFRRGVLR